MPLETTMREALVTALAGISGLTPRDTPLTPFQVEEGVAPLVAQVVDSSSTSTPVGKGAQRWRRTLNIVIELIAGDTAAETAARRLDTLRAAVLAIVCDGRGPILSQSGVELKTMTEQRGQPPAGRSQMGLLYHIVQLAVAYEEAFDTTVTPGTTIAKVVTEVDIEKDETPAAPDVTTEIIFL